MHLGQDSESALSLTSSSAAPDEKGEGLWFIPAFPMSHIHPRGMLGAGDSGIDGDQGLL